MGVSVPFRGFRGLQDEIEELVYEALSLQVSVPFRGFRGLQDLLRKAYNAISDHEFQSPSGVLGVCRPRTST